jgi:ABC-type methionine transport system ATPase subunit
MVKDAQRIERFKMTFPEKTIGEPIIYKLAHDMEVQPNILRGRITEKSAWLEVELSGNAKNVDKAVKFLTDRGVTLQKLDG